MHSNKQTLWLSASLLNLVIDCFPSGVSITCLSPDLKWFFFRLEVMCTSLWGHLPPTIAKYFFSTLPSLISVFKVLRTDLLSDKTMHPEVPLSYLWTNWAFLNLSSICLTASIKPKLKPLPPWLAKPSGLFKIKTEFLL